MQFFAIQDNIRRFSERPRDMARSSAEFFFHFGSIRGCHNFLRLLKKLRIVIGMETSKFILQA
jgi:tryptophan synthase beta subunit